MKLQKTVLAACAVLVCAVAPAQDEIEFQTSSDWALGSDRFTDQSVIAVVPIPSAPIELFATATASLGSRVEIDAYARHAGAIYFSTKETVVLPGAAGVAADEDLIVWDGSAFSIAWDGSANGLPVRADLDAVHVESALPLVFSFSIDTIANLPGPGVVADKDVVRWNGAGFDFLLVFDGSAANVPLGANLTGFGVYDPTRWQFTFDIPVILGGTRFDDADVIEFNPVSLTWAPLPYLDSAAAGYPAGLDILDFETDPSVPLLVELQYFTIDAPLIGQPITIRWATLLEVENAGFHVWRTGATPLQLGERLTETLVPGLGTDFSGASYAFIDSEIYSGPTDLRGYWLEDRDFYGVSTFHGPVMPALGDDAESSVPDWHLW